jgi:diketogulonate reductase-like aldo/keto reductase
MPQEEPIRRREIPSTGEAIPVVGLGTWQAFDVGADARARADLREVLRRFDALGGRVVDSSPMYGRAESVVGDLTAELGTGERTFVATKVWTRGRRAGIEQMERSLGAMRADPMDLMQVHNLLDVDTHLDTLAQWKAQNRVRHVGVTHYQVSAHERLERLMRSTSLDFVQFNYSLATRAAETSLLPAAADGGVAVLINRPFEEGALFRRVRGHPLPGWAADIGCESWAQIFLKYVLANPAVTCVIPGTGDPDHLVDNVGAGRGPLPDAALRRRMVTDFEAL